MNDFLTDKALADYIANHTVFLFTLIPWAVTFALKFLAILAPSVKTNSIIELFGKMWPGKRTDIV